MSKFLNSRLTPLSAYVPGEQPEPGKYIKLNTNEFPYPPAIGVSESAFKAVDSMNLYSDLNCSLLKKKFKRVFGFEEKNYIFTNGSDEALYLCFLTFCGADKGVAFADITYGFYSVYADLCGIDKKIIPLGENFDIIPQDYASLGRTVFIANPNAPTGKKLSLEQISYILESNKNDIVVVDEAYVDFAGSGCAELLNYFDNLIVVGTFSKSRGMAGARLGYIIASEDLIIDIEKVKFSINPYNVNSLTQATGAAVLENNGYYVEKIKEICNTRSLFSQRLVELGFEVIPSYTNFVFTKHNVLSGAVIAEKLRENGILIRRFNNERIKDYLRITIGTPEQMETVVSVLESIVGGAK